MKKFADWMKPLHELPKTPDVVEWILKDIAENREDIMHKAKDCLGEWNGWGIEWGSGQREDIVHKVRCLDGGSGQGIGGQGGRISCTRPRSVGGAVGRARYYMSSALVGWRERAWSPGTGGMEGESPVPRHWEGESPVPRGSSRLSWLL